MMQTTLLFQAHSPTSQAAAEAYRERAPNARRRVYDLIASASGLTDEQIQESLRMNPNTQRPRRVELERAGLVADSGCTRKTKSGMAAVVWVCTQAPYPARWPSKAAK